MNKKHILWLAVPFLLASCGGVASTSSVSSGGTSSTTASSQTASSSTTVSSATSSSDASSASTSQASSSEETSSAATSSSTTATSYTAEIVLADDATTFTGSNVSVSGNTVTISAQGIYLISGSLSNGNIFISADDAGEVELDLNGVSITKSGASSYAPIYSVKGDKLKIKKVKKTTNTITDSRTSIVSGSEDNAAIFSNKKLSFSGSGSLTVAGNLKNGVASDTKIEAANGTLSVTAVNNAVKAHDSILLGDPDDEGTFNILSTGGDGVKVDEDATAALETGEFAGVKFQKGNYTISAYDDAVESVSNIYLEEGEGTFDATDTTKADKSKCLTATLAINLDGGTYNLNSASNDAINAATNVNVTAGSYTISAGDDGVHADNTLTISGGTLNVTKAYEGLEALYITATGGETSVQTTDDGWNAAGGSDTQQTGGWTGSTTTSGVTPLITISGGNHYVAANGDGIDSNGNIVVNGGFTVVSQKGGGNGPMDYGDGGSYSFKQSGGFLAAYGTNDMAVGSSGTQYSLLSTWSSAVSTSQYLILTNSGKSYAIKPEYYAAYSLYISSDAFTAGSVSLASTSAITGGSEVFKGVFTDFTVSTTSSITSGSWSSSSVNIGSTTSSEHGGGGFPG